MPRHLPVRAERLHDLVEPDVGDLQGPVKDVEACGAHDDLPWVRFPGKTRRRGSRSDCAANSPREPAVAIWNSVRRIQFRQDGAHHRRGSQMAGLRSGVVRARTAASAVRLCQSVRFPHARLWGSSMPPTNKNYFSYCSVNTPSDPDNLHFLVRQFQKSPKKIFILPGPPDEPAGEIQHRDDAVSVFSSGKLGPLRGRIRRQHRQRAGTWVPQSGSQLSSRPSAKRASRDPSCKRKGGSRVALRAPGMTADLVFQLHSSEHLRSLCRSLDSVKRASREGGDVRYTGAELLAQSASTRRSISDTVLTPVSAIVTSSSCRM